MSNSKLSLGLVGLGKWAQTCHLPIYQQSHIKSFIDLKAICSRSSEKSSQLAELHGVRNSFSNYDEMLDSCSLDVVVICTPDHLHTDYVLKALDKGCHVLVEKPLATSVVDCIAIKEKCLKVNKRVIVLFHKRADSLWEEAATIIEEGKLGKLQMGTVSIQNSLAVSGGGYFQSDLVEHTTPNWFLGTHMYDLVRFITRSNPLHVRATEYEGTLKSLGINAPDAIKADVIYANGMSISFLLSWNLPEITPSITKQNMVLHFEKGELELDGSKRGFYLYGSESIEYRNPYFLRNSNGRWLGYGARYLEESLKSLHDSTYASPVLLADEIDGYWSSVLAKAVEMSILSKNTQLISELQTETTAKLP